MKRATKGDTVIDMRPDAAGTWQNTDDVAAAKRPIKLTKSVVAKLPVPAAGQAIYRDSELKGFGLRVTSGGARTYIVEKRIGGKVRRVKIGRADALLAEKARGLAQEFLGTVASGRNPIAEKDAAKAQAITLGEALNDYLDARGLKLKPRTREQYRGMIEGRRKDGSPIAFADWRTKRVTEITAEMVQRRHRELSEGHGPAWANLAMRVLRLLINYASMRFDDGSGKPLIAVNPVKRLGQARLWNDVERRETVLRIEDMPAWYKGISAISDIGRDYLLLVLLTGLRRREAAALKWIDVDLDKARTLTVRDTKNGRDHVLPLSTQLLDLLIRRRAATDGAFVFPGRKVGTCLVEPKTLTVAVARACKVHTSVHDLRRTFATTAERLDISSYAVKRLLNHLSGSDVTAGYIVTDIERLRRPMQGISDFLFRAMGAAEANVVPLREAAHAAS
jgi:integrase